MGPAAWAFFGCSVLIVYTYFGYPLLLALWSALPARRSRQVLEVDAGNPGPLPWVSMIIPAYNEERVIERKIRNSLELDYPADLLEIVVVSDGSSDATEKVARQAGGEGVRLVFREDHQGKTACINAVLPGLAGEVLVFTDANAYFLPDALRWLVMRFQDPRIGCVMGELRYRQEGSLNASLGEGLYWNYENFIKERESLLGSTIVGNGAIYAMRRDLCRPLPLEAEADVANPLLALRAGYRVVFERRARCWERAATTVREEFGRKTRIITNQIATYLHGFRSLGPLRAGALFQIVSHKLLRWSVPFLLGGMLASSLLGAQESGALKWLAWVQIFFYLLGMAGWGCEARGGPVPRMLFVPYYFCAMNLSSLKGIVDFALGRRRVIWEKAASTR
jgi:cellulose synthase/poly-beta-1,6-N-acetylglucosamine synthase-like glycosyltransferase